MHGATHIKIIQNSYAAQKNMHNAVMAMVGGMKGVVGIYTGGCRMLHFDLYCENSVLFFHVYSLNTKCVLFSDVGQSYINLTVDALDVRVKAGEERVQWVVNVDAAPIPSFIWFDKSHEEIKPQNGMKYKIEERKGKTQITLIINKIRIQDAGTYEFRAYNDNVEKILNLTLTVTGK
jgi:hypothetical protein